MNYEKKYREALERAKKEWIENLDNCYTNYRERLEIIFPELAESEDERIRKTLIEYIKGIKSWNYFLGISREQMIAWLENKARDSMPTR